MTVRLKPIAEQVLVITGASSGIGLATARLAAQRGARVVLVARGEAALAEAARAIVDEGGEADYVVTDVGHRDQVEAAADYAVRRYGRIDSWINNAGVAIYARLVDTPDDEHERLMRTNYFGVVNGSLVAIPHLRASGGGALITLGTIGSDVPSAILCAYTASKFAVKAFVAALRMELEQAGEPISVTLIKPSGIATPLAEHAAVHAEGEALIPAPTYDPAVVARAIVDAACHPRHTVTVGGGGRATVLAHALFPHLMERLTGRTTAALIDAGRAPHAGSALFAPSNRLRERSSTQTGRTTSLYTAGVRHPWIARGAMIALVGAGALAWTGLRNRASLNGC